MTNTSKLKGRITEMGFNLSTLSRAAHISRPALRNKINGIVEFKAGEIQKICDLLNISRVDMCLYFFTEFVPKMETSKTC